MTDYVFDANGNTQYLNWDDPTAWYGGVVPDGVDAQVSIPTVTYTQSGEVYTSFITIASGESYTIQSLTITNNYLLLTGNLTIDGALDIETGGEIDLSGGTLTFGSLSNNGFDIQGYGQLVTAGLLDNTGSINGAGLIIDAAAFRNTGSITASGSSSATASAAANTVTINAASDPDFVNGTLGGGGTYEAGYSGILDLDLGGVITTDATTLEFEENNVIGPNGRVENLTGQINSFDAASGTYLALQTTLTTIAAAGRLVVDSATYTNSIALRIDGELTLRSTGDGPGSFTAPLLTIDAGGTVDGIGTVAGSIVNDGVIVSNTSAADDPSLGPQPGDLVLTGPVSGTGTLEVGIGVISEEIGIHPPPLIVDRSVLELAGATSQAVQFLDATGQLILDDPASFSGIVTTQLPGAFSDMIILDGVSLDDITAYNYAGNSDGSGGTLTIAEGQTTQTLRFAGSHQTSDFMFSAGQQELSNSPPSLDISIACYARGTAIRTDQGNIPVEDLKIADRVATFDGNTRPIRWIGRRAYGGRFLASNPAVQPILFKAGSLGRYQPRRDLRVSPRHAMFLEGCLIPAECLINGSSVLRDTACTEVEYFHIELDSHDVVLAEDTPSETFVDDNSRGMFHNQAEYRMLYGDLPRMPAVYCAPRIEDGERLEEIRRAFGLMPTEYATLRGHLDDGQGGGLRGWAQDPGQPEVPVCLEIVADGIVFGRTVANLFRTDLAEAGLGSGRHGFVFALPEEVGDVAIEIRRAGDHAKLGSTPRRRQVA